MMAGGVNMVLSIKNQLLCCRCGDEMGLEKRWRGRRDVMGFMEVEKLEKSETVALSGVAAPRWGGRRGAGGPCIVISPARGGAVGCRTAMFIMVGLITYMTRYMIMIIYMII
jgi:hypothetical protein